MSLLKFFLSLAFVWEEGIEYNEKKIFLEYSPLPLFESFNGENGKSILLFWSLGGRE